MGRYAARRLLEAIPTLFIVSALVFGLMRIAPGDPAAMQMGREAARPENAEKLAALRSEMKLDRSIPVQYAYWLSDLARGDFGTSYRSGRPVIDLITEKIPATVQLLVGSMILALAFGTPLAILAALRRGSLVDRGVMAFVSAGLAVPSFWLGLTLILLLSVRWKMLPPAGYVSVLDDPWTALKHMVMPAVTLGVYLAATLMRFLRADMIEVMGTDYIRTARAKGLRSQRVVTGHAMRNAMVPVLTIAGLEIGALLGGSVIIEQVFGWSGVGWLIVQAVFDRDYPIVQTAVLFVAVGLVLVNLLVDLAYGWLNPRVRASYGR
ncbi:MAG: ABC transporter permease [Thermomicrobiales bacterium]|nr:ABC transporter permease [Thermomicrobiales bacterium]